ncbi:MAG TPA: fumarylacetoacetate hydrolase family protein [Roseomonas sp.]|nr:fumarylacetoacetate hydrolase family protein [Roseomonas sp.]
MAIDAAAAAAALLEARRSRRWLEALPEGARPADMEDVYAIQALVAAELGPIAGWKVGAASPTAEPGCAPLHAQNLRFDATPFRAAEFNITGIEAEIGYRLGADLPPRDAPYSREEVMAAIATMHPTIEIVDTRFVRLGLDPLSHSADQTSHGALVVGPALAYWQRIAPPGVPVRLSFNGTVAVEHVGGNSAGEPIRLVQWLANTGARRYGGLKAGMVITTGSCTGNILVSAGTKVRAEFQGVGVVETEIQ